MVRSRESGNAFDADLKEGRHHDDGEDEYTDRFETSTTDRVGISVLTCDHPGGEPNDDRTKEVQRRIDQTGYNRERGRHDGHNDLHDQKRSVGRQIDVKCQFHNRAVCIFILLNEFKFE